MAGLDQLALGHLGPSGKVLCLGAHCDDIEIGCGATLVELAKRWPDLDFHILVFCSRPGREEESRLSLASLLGPQTKLTLHFAELRDSYLPYRAFEAKEYLINKVGGLEPNLVFSHYREDLHQDHRFVGEITYQVFRSALILEMEIPKYDGDMGRPNVYFPASETATNHKISTLMSCYPSQREKDWFSEDTFRAIMRLRGLECRSATGMAEAFYASKIVVSY